MTAQLWTYRAWCVRVIDGDTIELELDLGFHIRHRVRVRVADVNCPELRSSDRDERLAGTAAREFVVRWLHVGLGAWPLTVATGKDRTFDRWVGSVSRVVDGEDLAAAIIGAGHGVAS